MLRERWQALLCGASVPAEIVVTVRCAGREGEVRSWGINDYGQLGNGSTTYETKPGPVVGLEDVHVADVAAGGWHSLAISQQGGVRTSCAALQVIHSTHAAPCLACLVGRLRQTPCKRPDAGSDPPRLKVLDPRPPTQPRGVPSHHLAIQPWSRSSDLCAGLQT